MSNLHIEENVGVHTMTIAMYEALERAGTPVGLHPYAGQDHFFDQEPRCGEVVANAMAFFMARYASAAMASASPNH